MKKQPTKLPGLLLVVLACLGGLYGWLFVQAHSLRARLPPGNATAPHGRLQSWNRDSAYAQAVTALWAQQALGDWDFQGKGEVPRILLARFSYRQMLPESNAFLLGLQPHGQSGSRWWLHPQGDYDFTLTVLPTILWLYGEDESRLYPAAREHLLNVLLTEDGNAFRATVPRTLGLVRETENHLLMTEGSRYLKSRWLSSHGNTQPRFDNAANGMEERILALLKELRTAGLYEFNSQPYIGYTITALLNLEAFGSDPVRASTRDLLDQLNWHYALGSYRLRDFPPFRRRYEYADMTALDGGYQTTFMKAWLSFAPERFAAPKPPELRERCATHALMAISLPYRPPDAVVKLLFDKGNGYFARLGHAGACPEIYSAGKHFLLSGGGVNRGDRSLIVARPITLFLEDPAADLSQIFHLAGPGHDFRQWNDTGVYRNVACAAGPVQVPSGAIPIATNGQWRLYAPAPRVLVAVYSVADFGLLVVFEGADAGNVFPALLRANPGEAALKEAFQFPGGQRITYDVMSPKSRWVMISDDDTLLDRDFDHWPLVEIESLVEIE